MAELAPQPILDQIDANLSVDPEKAAIVQKWATRREEGLKDRRRYEPTWHLCQAFLANRQWVGWSPGGRGQARVVEQPNPTDRERHTENVITQYLETVMGKLHVDDFMPPILFRRNDVESMDFAQHANQALRYCWDSELGADKKISDALRKMGAYGTSGLRCSFDPSRGKVLGELPIGPDGKPIVDLAAATQYVAQAQEQGQQVRFRTVREGRIVWEPLSPFNIIPPPGVEHEDYFPWLILERPLPVERIQAMYPEHAHLLREQELSQVDGGRENLPSETVGAAPSGAGRMKGHAICSTGYEMPSIQFPNGVTVVWSDKVLLDVKEGLPYELDGEPHHGTIFFKYHQIPGRFWSVGVVEPLIGPQRQRNRARSQLIEMKDRAGLGRVYAHKGTLTASNKPTGKIMEVIEVPLGHQFPQETTGTGPGAWLKDEVVMNDEAMDRIAGLREVSLGQAPAGVSAFSAMALLKEQDDRRVGPILMKIRIGIAEAVKLTLYDIRRYWPQQKQIDLAGPSGQVESFIFSASRLPETILVEVPKLAATPQSPAANVQKIFDVYNAALGAGRPLPPSWLLNSLNQGKPLPIPEDMIEVQRNLAELENMMIFQNGTLIQPNYYDDDPLHIETHRRAQMEAQGAGNVQQAQLLEFHIQLHAESMQNKQRGVGSPGQVAQNPPGMAPPGAAVPQQQGGRGGEAPQ